MATNSDKLPLEVSGLTKHFGALTAVSALDLRLARGEVLGLLGANGAGKTTTLALLLGLVTPSAGTIRLFGVDPERNRAAVRQRMNFSSPYVDLPHRLTVRQNLRVYAGLYGIRRPHQAIDRLLEQFGISELGRQQYGQLSSGQRTRVALAKALINQPELLLLDEPTVSLDPDIAERVRTWLTAYRAETGAAILITSHNMLEIERLCDRLVILKQGRAVAEGTPAEVIARAGRSNLEEVFLDIARNKPPEASVGEDR